MDESDEPVLITWSSIDQKTQHNICECGLLSHNYQRYTLNIARFNCLSLGSERTMKFVHFAYAQKPRC